MKFKIDRPLYVIIEWPESQIIPQLPSEHFDKCWSIDATYPTFAVPVEIWNGYLAGEIKIIEES
jgi:hypothetical protein